MEINATYDQVRWKLVSLTLRIKAFAFPLDDDIDPALLCENVSYFFGRSWNS